MSKFNEAFSGQTSTHSMRESQLLSSYFHTEANQAVTFCIWQLMPHWVGNTLKVQTGCHTAVNFLTVGQNCFYDVREVLLWGMCCTFWRYCKMTFLDECLKSSEITTRATSTWRSVIFYMVTHNTRVGYRTLYYERYRTNYDGTTEYWFKLNQ